MILAIAPLPVSTEETKAGRKLRKTGLQRRIDCLTHHESMATQTSHSQSSSWWRYCLSHRGSVRLRLQPFRPTGRNPAFSHQATPCIQGAHSHRRQSGPISTFHRHPQQIDSGQTRRDLARSCDLVAYSSTRCSTLADRLIRPSSGTSHVTSYRPFPMPGIWRSHHLHQR